ncbi:hypothetical protein [Chryseobacterium luquanense]|uniref:Uncharacterized protein n=1 Tax=Chryseobacterium luquanense TaxID=2983766 RepID=A0ABT3Y5T0_9FLAO|nr:hypothetical protein [Chryseobacterium luquanense]MCX8533516.1 hypothetical protein [Chryseobacterium luquanense]
MNNVSNDSTFNAFLSQNENGQLGKTNGVQPFLTLPNILTEEEKTAWKTAMNGGWTTNTMSVGLISPPMVDNNLNHPTWFLLKGTNLNLNPTSFSIVLIDSSDNVIAAIPNNQVQLNSNGIELTFYYNFSGFQTGDFRVRLWNGVSYHTTTMHTTISNTFPRIDLNSLNWDKVFFGGNSSSIIQAVGSSVVLKTDQDIKALADDNEIISSLMSNQFIGANKDFYLSYNTTANTAINPSFTTIANTYISLIPVGTPNNLIIKGISQLKHNLGSYFSHPGFQAKEIKSFLNGIQLPVQSYVDVSYNVVIQRTGQLYTVVITNTLNNQISNFSFTGTSEALCLLVQGSNRAMTYENTINFIEGFELN